VSGPAPHLGSAGREHAEMRGSLHPAAATAGAPASAVGSARSAVAHPIATRWEPLVRLAAFAGLAAYGAGHWNALVADPSTGRTLLVVLVATGGGALLALLGMPGTRSRLTAALGDRPRGAGALVIGLALLTGLVTVALGLGAAGLSLRLLGPENWGELADGLDRGLGGVQSVNWPYDGQDAWIRLTILLGAPFLLGIAATLAFFPARRGRPVLRAAGLVVLLLLYGMAVTEHDPGEPLLRGLVLLVLVAGWLWLPRLGAREAAAGGAVVVAVGLMSMPVAAALDGDRPWWDYRAWNWFGGGKALTFSWDHEYGPLDWPREGTTLLNIRSDRPHYWKAETLNAFDGLRWIRTPVFDRSEPDLPQRYCIQEGTWDYFECNERWDHEFRVTVRSLTTDLVLSAGTIYRAEGVDYVPSADGTARVQGDPLEEGETYTVRAYAPDPSAGQMIDSEEHYSDGLRNYTAIVLPAPTDSATEGVRLQGDAARSAALEDREEVQVPLRGDPLSGDSDADERLRESRYGDMYRLALDWTRGTENPYEAIKAIERRLQQDYAYAETVPTRALPLNGFLFQERRGYCQQFSGVMALMLRMVGIPARVAAGFSPGSYNADSGEFRVRDLDAHSWVEVYFTGIGWVPFDPTPTRAPAASQSAGVASTSAARGDAGEVSNPRDIAPPEPGIEGGALVDGGDGGGDWVVPVLVVLILLTLAGTGAYVNRRVRARAGLSAEQIADAQLAELRRALDRLGWNVPAGTTLLGLEQRLARVAGPASARYAKRLRAHRYDPREPSAPGRLERRALRRELTARTGLRGRLRGLLAIPPGGPSPT
jgi:protein-glutamine gamma-glutamyltransferase